MNKAEFRAIRERCGITQKTMALLLGKSIETVKKYEKPGYIAPGFDEADRLADLVDRHRKAVERIVADAGGGPRATLDYYRSQAHYERCGGSGDYAMANARAREAAAILELRGVEVRFDYPKAGGAIPDTSGVDYDLSDWEWFERPAADRPAYLEFTASDGRNGVRIITNRYGEGRWAPDRGAYRQVAGTGQYRLPDTREKLKAELEAMWADRYVTMPPVPDETRMEAMQRESVDAVLETRESLESDPGPRPTRGRRRGAVRR